MNGPISDAQTFQVQASDPRLAEYLKEYPAAVFNEQLYQSIELLERYSVDMAIDLARRLNVTDHLSQWRSLDDLGRILSFQPSFKFALHWILERLVEIDCVEARTDENARFYRLRHTLRKPDLENLRAAALQIDPANAATLDLLDRAAVSYQLVLTKIDKLKPGELAKVESNTLQGSLRHGAAHPELVVTSAVLGQGIAELRARLAALTES